VIVVPTLDQTEVLGSVLCSFHLFIRLLPPHPMVGKQTQRLSDL
jgi:hypothetical protein